MIAFVEFKKHFMFALVGSLVASALVAVATVLLGEFNEISARVLWTLAMVMFHSLISLAFIWDNDRQKGVERLAFFVNTLFALIVVSFITSILGTWKVLHWKVVADLYQAYFVLAFAALHGDILSKALDKETYLDWIIRVNYFFMAVVVLMLLPIIFVEEAFKVFDEMYFRSLGAVGIVDGTLSILAIIFYRLYMNRNPKEKNLLGAGSGTGPAQKKGLSVWVWVLIVILLFQVIVPVFLGFGFLAANSGFLK